MKSRTLRNLLTTTTTVILFGVGTSIAAAQDFSACQVTDVGGIDDKSFNETAWRGGKYEYDVVRNGRKTGEFARHIEFRKGQVIIWGADGRRIWNGRCFV